MPNLPPGVEVLIADVARVSASNGFGLSRVDLQEFVGKFVRSKWNCDSGLGRYLQAKCKFVDGVPSRMWVSKFMAKHKLCLRKPQPLQKCRLQNASDPEIVYEFYDLLEQQVSRLNLENKPGHIINIDETCCVTDPSRGKVVAGIGQGHLHRNVSGAGRESYTVVGCVSADGSSQPPLIIFPAKHLYTTWCGKDVIPGTTFAKSDKGWMTAEVFTSWLSKLMEAIPQRPLLMIMDGHKTHLTLETVLLAEENGVTLLKLPSHTTDKLQPLDVSVYGPLKAAWDRQVIVHQRSSNFGPITKAVFVDIVSKVWPKAMQAQSIISGFRTTGIFPVDRKQYPLKAFDPKKLAVYRATHPEAAPVPLTTVVEEAQSPPMSSQKSTQFAPTPMERSSLTASLVEVSNTIHTAIA
jgi:hypothetical protein